jgi:hypothetical protein
MLICDQLEYSNKQGTILSCRRPRVEKYLKLPRISLFALYLLLISVKVMDSSSPSSSVSKIIPDRMLTNTTFELSLFGFGMNSITFVAISDPGGCESPSKVVMQTGSSSDIEECIVNVPPISIVGAFVICVSNSTNLSSAAFLEQDVRLEIISVFGVVPKVLYIKSSTQTVQLMCEGRCSDVKVGLSLPFSENCTLLLRNSSFLYGPTNESGNSSATFIPEIDTIGTYSLCWSADGSNFFPTHVSVSAIRRAENNSILNLIPSNVRQLQNTLMLFVLGADCSLLSYVAFIPTSQSVCSNFSLIVPLPCSTMCPTNITCAMVNFPQNVNPGSFRVCFSTSGINGQYTLQTQVSSNLSVMGPSCPLCAAGESIVTDSASIWPPICVKCKPGFVCPNGSSLMIPCPNGTYSKSPGSSDFHDCLRCNPGSYSMSGASACSPCEAGSFCAGGLMYLCARGSYSTPGLSSCIDCPAGYYCSAPAIYPIPCQGCYGSPLPIVCQARAFLACCGRAWQSILFYWTPID